MKIKSFDKTPLADSISKERFCLVRENYKDLDSYLFMKQTVRENNEDNQRLVGLKVAQSLCYYLEEKGISYSWCIKHPRVLGCDDSLHYYDRFQTYIGTEADYSIAKNIFVREKKGERRMFLLVTDYKKQLDLKKIQRELDTKKLEFVDCETIRDILRTFPGNLSIFHLIYDQQERVNVLLDEALFTEGSSSFVNDSSYHDKTKEKTIAFHPLYNEMSLFLSSSATLQFLDVIHHSYQPIDLPTLETENYPTNKILTKSYNIEKVVK